MRSRPGSAPNSSPYGRVGGGAITVSPTPGRGRRRAAGRCRAPIGSRTSWVLTVPTRRARAHRQAALRGLEPDEPGTRRRDPDRPAAVAGVGDRHESGGDCGGGAAARSARRVLAVPRVAGRAVGLGSVTGRLPNSGLLVRPSVISPALRKRTTRFESCFDSGGSCGRPVARRERQPGQVMCEVLDQERHAGERASRCRSRAAVRRTPPPGGGPGRTSA